MIMTIPIPLKARDLNQHNNNNNNTLEGLDKQKHLDSRKYNMKDTDNDHKSLSSEDGIQVGRLKPDIPMILNAPSNSNYYFSGFVHCCVTRDYSNTRARFNFRFQIGHENLSMIAERQLGNRTSNYHIFDTSRGGMKSKLQKKAGHYLGKLRKSRTVKSGYSLYNANQEKEQVAIFVFDLPSLTSQWKEGQPPRRMQAAIPEIDNKGKMVSSAVSLKSKMFNCVGEENKEFDNVIIFNTKEPSFEGGQYRLNFRGRVSIPSVKNMQLVNDQDDIIAQFGRVGEDRFHLDYK